MYSTLVALTQPLIIDYLGGRLNIFRTHQRPVFSESSGLAVAIVLAVRDCAAITGFLTDWAAMDRTADSQLTQLGKIAAAAPRPRRTLRDPPVKK